MSHRQMLEQALELLINEEHDAASDLLHTVMVEKARSLYEELVDEDFGGDEKEDFADEIEADKDEIEADEIYDGEEGDEESEDDVEVEDDDSVDDEEVEDRLEDVEASLAELRAEFDSLMGGDADVEGDEFADDEFADAEVEGDFEGDVDVEDDAYEGMYEEDFDGLDEATKLQDEVSNTGQKEEGKHAGTGAESKIGATGKESQFTKAPRKSDHGGKPHKTGEGGDESTKKVGQGKDNTPTSNVNVKQQKETARDKNVAGDDKGAKSTLGSQGSPKGA